jgi:hypothetical protein
MYQPTNRFETSSVAEAYNHAKDQAVEMTHRAQELVEEHPGSSALVAFGVGVAVGLAVVACLPPQRRAISNTHLPDWLSLKELARFVPEQLTRNW